MWEIYAYQNSDSLFGIFNACAAIFASADYLGEIAAVAFFGFASALIGYAFAPEKLQGWKWLGSVVLVWSVLIVPKVSVGIIDKTGGSAVKVVDNVPFGVAMLGSVTSTIGNSSTQLFETAFQTIPGAGALPSELAYAKNGLMFGNRLVKEVTNVTFQDPNFRTDLINFIHNCTTYDLIDGHLNPADFSSSGDVWALMREPNPARFSPVTNAAGTADVDTCPNVYNILNGRIPAQINRIQGKLAFQLNPTLPAPAAAAVIANQVQQAYFKNQIADASLTSADLIRQSAMLNAIKDTGKMIGQKTNDPASMVLAVGRAQAVAQQNATWINFGKVAEQALPVFRNSIEALSYAMFPLFVLLLLTTSGRETMLALKGYAALLIWIQLWPPLYAILNYMASIYAAHDLAAAADLGTGVKALSLQTASAIYSGAISGEAVVGYLAISIPVLAWSALKRMETLGTAMVGGLSGLQGLLTGSTSASTVGNTNMGNVSMDQTRLAPNRTSAFMSTWQDNVSGDTYSSNVLNGRTAVSLLRNQGFASRTVSVQATQQDVNEASRQVDAARSEALTASTERSAALTSAFSRGLSKLHSARDTQGETSSGFEQFGSTVNRLDQITKTISDTTGLSQAQVANIGFGASASLGVKLGFFKAGVDASARKSYASTLSAQEQRALGAMTNEQLAEFKQFGDRISRDNSFSNAVSNDSSEARDMSSRLSSTTSKSQRAEAQLSERTAFSERVSTAFGRGESISIDIAQDPHNLEMFMRFSNQYGGNSASAQALMAAELARQALPPNSSFSDGTALPASFGTPRQIHERNASSPRLQPNIDRQDRGHRTTVSQSMASEPDQHSASDASIAREDILRQGQDIKQRVHSTEEKSDSRLGGVKDADGTLKSKNSLALKSLKQVGNDAEATFDNVKKTVDQFRSK